MRRQTFHSQIIGVRLTTSDESKERFELGLDEPITSVVCVHSELEGNLIAALPTGKGKVIWAKARQGAWKRNRSEKFSAVFPERPFYLVAGVGFEPTTFGL